MYRNAEPLIIDIEASGFGPESYPIEIGIALSGGNKFCSLIAPATSWTFWDPCAETMHRVSRQCLVRNGRPLNEVAGDLNHRFAGMTFYSDGWVVDKPWLVTLFHAAGQDMQFRVSPLEVILKPEQMEVWHATKDQVIDEMNVKRHRASIDAWVIQETYRRTLPGWTEPTAADKAA